MSHPTPYAHPAWFGAVMGSGGAALALNGQAHTWDLPALHNAALAMLAFASLAAVGLLPRYAARLRDRAALRAEMSDPTRGAMLATFPAGVSVLAIAWSNVGEQHLVGAALAAIGAALTLVVALLWSAAMMETQIDLAGVHGGWMIPPAMSMLVPLAIAPLLADYPDAAAALTALGFGFLGVGVVLFLIIMTLLVARLALRGPLPAQLTPSLFIPVAPMGIMGLAAYRLAAAAAEAQVNGFTSGASTVGLMAFAVGIGLWWLTFAVLEVQRMRRSAPLPVHPGWWGFVFPVSALTLELSALAGAIDSTFVSVTTAGLAVGLIALWLVVLAKTARMAFARG